MPLSYKLRKRRRGIQDVDDGLGEYGRAFQDLYARRCGRALRETPGAELAAHLLPEQSAPTRSAAQNPIFDRCDSRAMSLAKPRRSSAPN